MPNSHPPWCHPPWLSIHSCGTKSLQCSTTCSSVSPNSECLGMQLTVHEPQQIQRAKRGSVSEFLLSLQRISFNHFNGLWHGCHYYLHFQMRKWEFRELNWFAYVTRSRLELQMTSHSCKLVRGLVSGKYSRVSIHPFVFSSPRGSTRLFVPLLWLLTYWLPSLALLLLLKQDWAQGLALALLANFPLWKSITHTLWVYFLSLCLNLQTIISTCLRDIFTWTSCWYLKANISQAKRILFLFIIWFFFFFSFSNNTLPELPLLYSKSREGFDCFFLPCFQFPMSTIFCYVDFNCLHIAQSLITSFPSTLLTDIPHPVLFLA